MILERKHWHLLLSQCGCFCDNNVVFISSDTQYVIDLQNADCACRHSRFIDDKNQFCLD